jgi:hypothetical protein
MDSTSKRLLAVVIALLVTVGIVVLQDRGDDKSKATSTATPTARLGTIGPARCDPLPGKAKLPSWYPENLPLPEGSYAAAITLPTRSSSYPQAIFAVRGSLKDFVIHALEVWPKSGWKLGRGEAEPGEAEDNFHLPGSNLAGAFIARTTFCDPTWTWVYIVLGTGRAPRPTPRPTGSATFLQ